VVLAALVLQQQLNGHVLPCGFHFHSNMCSNGSQHGVGQDAPHKLCTLLPRTQGRSFIMEWRKEHGLSFLPI
jgi:hypothetical protein